MRWCDDDDDDDDDDVDDDDRDDAVDVVNVLMMAEQKRCIWELWGWRAMCKTLEVVVDDATDW